MGGGGLGGAIFFLGSDDGLGGALLQNGQKKNEKVITVLLEWLQGRLTSNQVCKFPNGKTTCLLVLVNQLVNKGLWWATVIIVRKRFNDKPQ